MRPWQRNTLLSLSGAVTLLVIVLVSLSLRGGTPDTTERPPGTVTTAPTPATSTTASPSSSTSTTTTPSTPATTTTITTTTTAPQLFLYVDAISEVTFGSDADQAAAELSELFGEPDEDTGWFEKSAEYWTCIGDTIRFARWGSLQVFFTDGATDWAPAGKRHLAAYGHGENVGTPLLDLRTEDGLEVGLPVGDLRVLFGDRLRVDDDPLFGPLYQIEFVGAGLIYGELTGVAPDDRVLSIAAGISCGE